MNGRTILIVGAIFGFTGVLAGTFGAHGLEPILKQWHGSSDRLPTWEIAVRYQMYHALALLALCGISHHYHGNQKLLGIVGWLFTIGTLIFSGTLYGLVLSGIGILGAITPIGGLLLLAGWLTLTITAFRMQTPSSKRAE